MLSVCTANGEFEMYHRLIPEVHVPLPNVTIVKLEDLLKYNKASDFLSVDVETTGLYTRFHPETVDHPRIITIAISDGTNTFAAPVYDDDEVLLIDVIRHLSKHYKLIYYNAYFDVRWLVEIILRHKPSNNTRKIIKYLLYDDVYYLYRMLSTEQFLGQEWSLKFAQQKVLGWPERGDTELNQLLLEKKLTKGDLDKVRDHEIVLRYNGYDAYSAYHLYKILLNVIEKFQIYHEFRDIYVDYICKMIENYIEGIYVDYEKLKEYAAKLEENVKELSRKAFSLPSMSFVTDEINSKLKEIEAARPPELTKDGKQSRQYLLWKRRYDTFMQEWRELGCPTELYNLRSVSDIKTLAYQKLLNDVQHAIRKDAKTKKRKEIVDASTTAAKHWGEFGKVYQEWYAAEARLRACRSYISHVDPKTNRLHPVFKIHGTVSGRLAGSGGVNLLNPPKEKEFLECLREPDPDNYMLVDFDIKNCECVLMAIRSCDEGFNKLFGKTAKPNDPYIYFMTYLGGVFEEACKEFGYDRDNPTKDSIEGIKKKYKSLRNIAKMAFLALQYGISPKGLLSSFTSEGVTINGQPVTLQFCEDVYNTFWNAFSGLSRLTKWHSMMISKYNLSISTLGFILLASPDKIHKLANNDIQMTGHQFLLYVIYYLTRNLDNAGVEWKPFLLDFHDQCTLRLKKIDGDEQKTFEIYKQCLQDAVNKVNTMFSTYGFEFSLQVDPSYSYTFDKFKL